MAISISPDDLEDLPSGDEKAQFTLCRSCKRRSRSTAVVDDDQSSPSRHSGTTTPTTHRESLVGSYEESLLSKRLAASSCSKPIVFDTKLGVIEKTSPSGPPDKWPTQVTGQIEAVYYHWDKTEQTAYVADMDVSTTRSPFTGYKIPRCGQLQIIVSNPQKTCVHLFLVPYDLRDMPAKSKTFIRQKVYSTDPRRLIRAVHIPVCCPRKSRIYIHSDIRLVFNNTQPWPSPSCTDTHIVTGGYSRFEHLCPTCL